MMMANDHWACAPEPVARNTASRINQENTRERMSGLDLEIPDFLRRSRGAKPVADEVEAWARENEHLRIALCGHKGDYDLPDWTPVDWSRGRLTYSGKKTTDQECVWYSPPCLKPEAMADLFARAAE